MEVQNVPHLEMFAAEDCKLSTTSLQIAYQSLTRFIYVHLNDNFRFVLQPCFFFFRNFYGTSVIPLQHNNAPRGQTLREKGES